MHLQRAVFTLLCARCDWEILFQSTFAKSALPDSPTVPGRVFPQSQTGLDSRMSWQYLSQECLSSVSWQGVSQEHLSRLPVCSQRTCFLPLQWGSQVLSSWFSQEGIKPLGTWWTKYEKLFVFLSRFVPMTVKSTSPGLHAISVALNCLHCAMLLLNWSYYSFRLSILYTVNMMFFLFAWEQLQKPKHMFKEFSTRLSKVCKCWISWMKGSFWKNYTPTLHAHSTLSKNECYSTILPHVWQKHSAFQQHLFL